MAHPNANRIRPIAAWRSLQALHANPEDTARVFEVIRAMSGNSAARAFRRFARSEAGARILAEERDLLATLRNLESLRALPPDSLGRTYARFMTAEQLSADGLVDASMQAQGPGESGLSQDRQRFGARLRDSHDLWHVVTGYNRDLAGEIALLAFTFAQTRNPGIGLIVGHVYWRARGGFRHARRMIRQALWRGLRAAWLPAADWEALLARPLAEVRRELRVGDPPDYTQVRSSAAPVPAES